MRIYVIFKWRHIYQGRQLLVQCQQEINATLVNFDIFGLERALRSRIAMNFEI